MSSTAPADPPTAAATFEVDEQAIREHLIGTLDSQSPFRALNHLIAGTAIGLLLWNQVEQAVVLAWLGALYALWVLRALVRRAQQRTDVAQKPAMRAATGVCFAAVFGLAWGCSAWLFVTPDNPMVTALISVAVMGLASAAAISLASYPPACYAFMLPCLLGLISALLREPDLLNASVALLAIYSLIGSVYNSHMVNRELRQNVRLSKENLALRQEAESKNELLETTLHNMDQGIALFAADGSARMHNQRFFELLGWAPDSAELRELLTTRQSPREVEAANGRTLELHDRHLASGMHVCTVTDISLLKFRQREAEQANAAKTRFLAAASHDLRQPIHALGLMFETLVAKIDDVALAPLIGKIDGAILAVDSMLNALLDISKLDAGVVKPAPVALDLGAMLARLDVEFQAVAEERGNRLRVRPRSVAVRTDELMLERILRNLISNALRYTEHGRVLVGMRVGADAVRVEVYDTGPGIPEDRLEEIFLEFHQLGNLERDRRQGLGLGLAIVRRIAGLLDHPLTLRSREGYGSMFAISLPRCDPADALPPAEAQALADRVQGELCGRRVLVLDDDPDIREAMQALLESWGVKVVAAAALEEALALLESAAAPELMLVDYRLRGETDGVAAIASLRRRFEREIPAVLVTGDTAPERLQQARDSGFPLLHKPVRPAAMRNLLRQQLRRRVVLEG